MKQKQFFTAKKLASLKYSVVVYSVNRIMLYVVIMLVCGRWRSYGKQQWQSLTLY